ncbi:TPA: restriction endonuclease subunit S [Photobacterium damselae]
MVPNGWETRKLSTLGDGSKPAVKAGPFGSAIKKEYYVSSGYKVYGQEQVIADDAFIGDYFIDEEKFQSLKSCSISPGDILISLVGTVGRVLLVPENAVPGIINPRLLRLSLCNSTVNGVYIKYFLETEHTKNTLNSWAQGGTMGVLNAEMLKSLNVPVPPLPEQRKIAQILSTWDRGIATTEKLIDASKQQKKALMQQLLTGKKRLINPETGKAFKGEWEEVKLDDLALYRRGSFPQPYGNPEWVDEVNGYPFIQVFDIDKNMKLKKVTKTKISDAAIDKSVFIEAGTVIVSLQGSIGRVAITQYDAYVDRTVLLFQSFKRKMDTIYFAYAIKELFEIEKEKAPGGTIKTITKQVLSNFTIKVPTHYEQQKIASVLTAADKEIELLEAKLAHFKQEKKALMQQLLTGKRRVKIAETKVVTEETLEVEVA